MLNIRGGLEARREAVLEIMAIPLLTHVHQFWGPVQLIPGVGAVRLVAVLGTMA